MTRAPEFTVAFGRAADPAAADGRLDAAAFHRNRAAIGDALAADLAAMQGDVLEIGSGTGQHAVAFAQQAPHLTWWPSDPNADHRRSVDAWRAHTGLANLRPAANIDVSQPDWTWGNKNPPPPLAAIFCANVIHIAPWSVAQGLFAGAERHLRSGGKLYLYGPFKMHGEHTAPSNAAFDESLRARDPAWGVRDIDDVNALARRHHLTPDKVHTMPANNLILVFTRD